MTLDISLLKHIFLTSAVTVPRMAAVFWTVPFLSRRVLPGITKNSIVLCFMFILYPFIAPQVPESITSIVIFILVIAKEVLIGFLIGYVVSCIFWGVECAGGVIDEQRGAMSALISDPMPQGQTTPWGNFLFHTVTILFFINGGFLVILEGVFESYRIWPILSFFPTIDKEIAVYMLTLADKIMYFTLVFAAPVVIACFVSEFGLGLVNRFAPQLNVFFLSMAIKSGVACILLILYISFLFVYVKKEFIGADLMLALLKKVIQ